MTLTASLELSIEANTLATHLGRLEDEARQGEALEAWLDEFFPGWEELELDVEKRRFVPAQLVS